MRLARDLSVRRTLITASEKGGLVSPSRTSAQKSWEEHPLTPCGVYSLQVGVPALAKPREVRWSPPFRKSLHPLGPLRTQGSAALLIAIAGGAWGGSSTQTGFRPSRQRRRRRSH